MSIMNSKENKGKKEFRVYTPDTISKKVYEIIKQSGIKTDVVLEPSVGEGFMVKPFKENDKSKIIGCDIDEKGKNYCDEFYHGDFEFLDKKFDVDLVISNPPFNGHPKRKLYPEVFIRKIIDVVEKGTPIVMIVPHGFRLNQRFKSDRWRFIEENMEITSIMSLPVDVFPNVLFHTEVIFFNVPNIKPHYFLF